MRNKYFILKVFRLYLLFGYCLLCFSCSAQMPISDNPQLEEKADLNKFRIIWPHDKPIRLANRMAIAERSNLIALAGKRYGIHLYSIKTRNYLNQLVDPDDPEYGIDYPTDRGVYALAFTPDEKFLVSGNEASQIKIWDVEQKRLVKKISLQSGRINSLSISADGNQLVVGCQSGSIQIWDMRNYKKLYTHSGLLLKKFKIHLPVEQVAMLPNRQQVIFSAGGFLHWWDYHAEKKLHRFDGQKFSNYNKFTVSKSGKYLSASEMLWDLQTGKATALLEHHNLNDSSISSTFFSRDETVLFGTYSHSNLLTWNPQSGESVSDSQWSRRFRGGGNALIKILPDSRTVALFIPHRQIGFSPVSFLDLKTGKELFPDKPIISRAPEQDKFKIVAPGPVMLSSDGQLIVTGDTVRSAKNLDVIQKIDMVDVNFAYRELKSVAISSDHLLMATCAHTGSEQYIAVWKIHSGERLQKISNRCQQVMFSPDSKSILYVDDGLIVRKMDMTTGKVQFTIDQYKYIFNTTDDVPRTLDIISFSKQLALTINTKFEHGYIALHNGRTGQQQRVIRHGEFNHIRTSTISKNLKYAALVTSVAGDTKTQKLIVYSLSNGRIILQASMQKPCCYKIVIAPDNKRIYVATRENLFRVWNLSTGKQEPPLRYGWEPTFVSQYDNLFVSPDGQRLYFGSMIWDLRTRRQIRIPD